jgi:hypothetical protein
MMTRDALVGGVLAATDKVVQQVSDGDFHAALKSSADRRALLDQLAAQDPHAAEHGFLRALRDAAAESEAALDAMKAAAKRPVQGGRLCTKA